MSDQDSVSLTIHAAFDDGHESVGLVAQASDAFDEGDNTRAKIEVLAAITAKANSIAAEVIRSWDAPEARRQELYEHYAALKEQMLSDMLEEVEETRGKSKIRRGGPRR